MKYSVVLTVIVTTPGGNIETTVHTVSNIAGMHNAHVLGDSWVKRVMASKHAITAFHEVFQNYD